MESSLTKTITVSTLSKHYILNLTESPPNEQDYPFTGMALVPNVSMENLFIHLQTNVDHAIVILLSISTADCI